jgi:hypothetical protein
MYTKGSYGGALSAKANVSTTLHCPNNTQRRIAVGTQDATSTVPIDDAARRTWAAQFGYAGDLHEVVTLLNGEGQPCGSAAIADVWSVRRGLIALFKEYSNSFHRVGNWSESQRQPVDPAGRLSELAFGPLTHPQSGEWLPGRTDIINALLRRVPEDDVLFEFRDAPIAKKDEVSQAA